MSGCFRSDPNVKRQQCREYACVGTSLFVSIALFVTAIVLLVIADVSSTTHHSVMMPLGIVLLVASSIGMFALTLMMIDACNLVRVRAYTESKIVCRIVNVEEADTDDEEDST